MKQSELKHEIVNLSNTLACEMDATHSGATDNFRDLQSHVETLDTRLQYQVAKSRNDSEYHSSPVQVLTHLHPDGSKSLSRFANPENVSEEDASHPAKSEGPKGCLLMILS